MKPRQVKRYLAIVIMVAACHAGFAKDVEIPLITEQVDNLIKESFHGFPSVTFNFYLDTEKFYLNKYGWSLRFSTLNQLGQPYLPDLIFFGKSDESSFYIKWTFPHIFGVSMRFCYPY